LREEDAQSLKLPNPSRSSDIDLHRYDGMEGRLLVLEPEGSTTIRERIRRVSSVGKEGVISPGFSRGGGKDISRAISLLLGATATLQRDQA